MSSGAFTKFEEICLKNGEKKFTGAGGNRLGLLGYIARASKCTVLLTVYILIYS